MGHRAPLKGYDELDSVIGEYVYTKRPRTALEREAYAPFIDDPAIHPPEGGAGVVVRVGPVKTVTVRFGNKEESLTGREISVDYGMAWLVTADTEILFPQYEVVQFFMAHKDGFCAICERRTVKEGDDIGVVCKAGYPNKRVGQACRSCMLKIETGDL